MGALTLQRVEARLIEDAGLATAGLRVGAAPFAPVRAPGTGRRVTVELSSLLLYAPWRKRKEFIIVTAPVSTEAPWHLALLAVDILPPAPLALSHTMSLRLG